MSDERVARRVNVAIGLLLVVVAILIRGQLSRFVLPVGVVLLAPLALLAVLWALAKLSLVVESP